MEGGRKGWGMIECIQMEGGRKGWGMIECSI